MRAGDRCRVRAHRLLYRGRARDSDGRDRRGSRGRARVFRSTGGGKAPRRPAAARAEPRLHRQGRRDARAARGPSHAAGRQRGLHHRAYRRRRGRLFHPGGRLSAFRAESVARAARRAPAGDGELLAARHRPRGTAALAFGARARPAGRVLRAADDAAYQHAAAHRLPRASGFARAGAIARGRAHRSEHADAGRRDDRRGRHRSQAPRRRLDQGALPIGRDRGEYRRRVDALDERSLGVHAASRGQRARRRAAPDDRFLLPGQLRRRACLPAVLRVGRQSRALSGRPRSANTARNASPRPPAKPGSFRSCARRRATRRRARACRSAGRSRACRSAPCRRAATGRARATASIGG